MNKTQTKEYERKRKQQRKMKKYVRPNRPYDTLMGRLQTGTESKHQEYERKETWEVAKWHVEGQKFFWHDKESTEILAQLKLALQGLSVEEMVAH